MVADNGISLANGHDHGDQSDDSERPDVEESDSSEDEVC